VKEFFLTSAKEGPSCGERGKIMFGIFVIGVTVGIVLMIILIKQTMKNEPSGCIIIFGIIMFFICATMVIIPRLVLAGWP